MKLHWSGSNHVQLTDNLSRWEVEFQAWNVIQFSVLTRGSISAFCTQCKRYSKTLQQTSDAIIPHILHKECLLCFSTTELLFLFAKIINYVIFLLITVSGICSFDIYRAFNRKQKTLLAYGRELGKHHFKGTVCDSAFSIQSPLSSNSKWKKKSNQPA